MEDADYASKYADGAPRWDIPGKLKQAMDARFLTGATGKFVSGGLTYRPEADNGLLSLDVGAEAYMTSYLTGRISLMGMASDDDWFTGVDTGLRLQTPSRLAPFVGAGVYAGAARETVDASDDGIDNNDNGWIDEYNEEEKKFSGAFAAIYPELGAHFWWTPQIRLTSYGRYMIATEGRDADDWMLGFGVALFSK
ncbi:hypothetical protein LOC67_09080 [Stieleria sp. JC731]|uniref:hypothetical protein n=1 Tax=Pirellulaceae TaxID=2691357 RepID=UPI001E391DCE|nr:hypothetical protein [Stieleria sp. JC731]MCC9600715.1 hypothetical protein [Stieleria sp. JC731]